MGVDEETRQVSNEVFGRRRAGQIALNVMVRYEESYLHKSIISVCFL